MIQATYAERGKILSLRVEGHACYAEQGKDIICASASILVGTVACYVKTAEEDGCLACEPTIIINEGYALIECEPTEDDFEDMRKAYEFATVGMQILENSHPKHIKLITDVEV